MATPTFKYPGSFEKSSTSDTESKYRTVINFYEYKRFVGRGEDLRKTSSIILPLPLGVSDSNSIETGQAGNLLVTALANQLSGINEGNRLGQALEGLGKTIEGELDSAAVKNAIKAYASNISSESAATATENVARIGATFVQSTRPIVGAVLNPHSVLSFDGVALKNYELNWKLSPYSKNDVSRLKFIENEIKKRMYPELSVSNILLEYPHMCTVRFKNVNINPIRRSFVTNFNINFGSGDVMNLYKLDENSFPIVVTMQMTISELEIRTSENVNETDDLLATNPVALDNPANLAPNGEEISPALLDNVT